MDPPPVAFTFQKPAIFHFHEYISGQILATSHDLTPNGGLVREIPLFQGNLGWWNMIFHLAKIYGRKGASSIPTFPSSPGPEDPSAPQKSVASTSVEVEETR